MPPSAEPARVTTTLPLVDALAVVALTMLLRALWIALVPSHPVGDFALYLESAEDLVEGGRLDDHFIYMPGYVLALALVKGLGGGLFACKMVGVLAAGMGALGVWLLAHRLGGRRAGAIAGGLYAVWPAGIAVSSVTGTDAPTGALIVLAVALLVELGARGRWRTAAVAFGVVMGLASWLRAIALPLCALSFCVTRASGASLRRALASTALSVCVATVVLVPWGVRNHARYGQWFLTDSHGGHTALVGSNPNTEGAYGRSLNQLFTDVTGYRLFDEPAHHRASDHAAYELAKDVARAEPRFALGLLALKADRLLSHERNLLYWPLYRQGVLHGAARAHADEWRPLLERVTDLFWYALVGLALAASLLAAARRRWDVLALLPFVAVLLAIYVAFFAEVRYHLAFAPLLFVLAAWWLATMGRASAKQHAATLASAVLTCALLWPALLAAGERLRDTHRFAAAEIALDGRAALALWRRVSPPDGPSPVRGTGNALALWVPDGGDVAVQTSVSLAAGTWKLSLAATTAHPMPNGAVSLALRLDDHEIARGVVPDEAVDSRTQAARDTMSRPVETFTATVKVPREGTHALVLQAQNRLASADGFVKVFIDDLRFSLVK